MKISTETYQYQNNSGQYERFASGYVQPDYALLIDVGMSDDFLKTQVAKKYLHS